MPLSESKPLQEKPHIGDIVSDGFKRYLVNAVGLRYLNITSIEEEPVTGLVAIQKVFVERPAPKPEPEEEED